MSEICHIPVNSCCSLISLMFRISWSWKFENSQPKIQRDKEIKKSRMKSETFRKINVLTLRDDLENQFVVYVWTILKPSHFHMQLVRSIYFLDYLMHIIMLDKVFDMLKVIRTVILQFKTSKKNWYIWYSYASDGMSWNQIRLLVLPSHFRIVRGYLFCWSNSNWISNESL